MHCTALPVAQRVEGLGHGHGALYLTHVHQNFRFLSFISLLLALLLLSWPHRLHFYASLPLCCVLWFASRSTKKQRGRGRPREVGQGMPLNAALIK